jgi:hypothetical protein
MLPGRWAEHDRGARRAAEQWPGKTDPAHALGHKIGEQLKQSKCVVTARTVEEVARGSTHRAPRSAR